MIEFISNIWFLQTSSPLIFHQRLLHNHSFTIQVGKSPEINILPFQDYALAGYMVICIYWVMYCWIKRAYLVIIALKVLVRKFTIRVHFFKQWRQYIVTRSTYVSTSVSNVPVYLSQVQLKSIFYLPKIFLGINMLNKSYKLIFIINM